MERELRQAKEVLTGALAAELRRDGGFTFLPDDGNPFTVSAPPELASSLVTDISDITRLFSVG
jgi:hypothetical protein